MIIDASRCTLELDLSTYCTRALSCPSLSCELVCCITLYRLQRFISLIADLKMMKQSIVEIGYDAEKLPLGKLSKRTIQQGYEQLKLIAEVLKGNGSRSQLERLSSAFYSLVRVVCTSACHLRVMPQHSIDISTCARIWYPQIPHVTPGMRPPPVISTEAMLKEVIIGFVFVDSAW